MVLVQFKYRNVEGIRKHVTCARERNDTMGVISNPSESVGAIVSVFNTKASVLEAIAGKGAQSSSGLFRSMVYMDDQ